MNRWQWAGLAILGLALVGAWAVSRKPRQPAAKYDPHESLLDRIRHGGL